MPHWKKAKTRKAARKRFKITGTGKVIAYGHRGKRHLLATKSSKRRRSLGHSTEIGPSDAHRIKLNLPFGA